MSKTATGSPRASKASTMCRPRKPLPPMTRKLSRYVVAMIRVYNVKSSHPIYFLFLLDAITWSVRFVTLHHSCPHHAAHHIHPRAEAATSCKLGHRRYLPSFKWIPFLTPWISHQL